MDTTEERLKEVELAIIKIAIALEQITSQLNDQQELNKLIFKYAIENKKT
jgi:hypothetical protein